MLSISCMTSSLTNSHKLQPALADSLGLPPNESLKTKIPLKQIVQFAERLQKQTVEVIIYFFLLFYSHMQRFKMNWRRAKKKTSN